MPSAPDRRPSSAAVGCASSRSIFEIIARDTPDPSESALTVMPRVSRAERRVADSDVASEVIATILRMAATEVTMDALTTFARQLCFRDAHHLPMRP